MSYGKDSTENFSGDRHFSTGPADDLSTYEEIKDLPNHKEKLLIDVREPQELIDTGVIPTSINIPRKFKVLILINSPPSQFLVNQVPEKLSSEFSKEEFAKLFKREKPHHDTPLIFSCKIGVRSGNASEFSRQLGYKK